MATIEEFLFYWQIFIGVICLIITSLSIQKHRSKGNALTRLLMIMFIFFFGSIVFQAMGTYYSYVNELNHGSTIIGEPNWFLNLMIYLVKSMQISQFFVILGIFTLYLFSMQIFSKQTSTIYDINSYCLYNHYIYGLLCFKPVFNIFNEELNNIAYFLMIYVIVVLFPMLIHCFRLIRKLDKKESIKDNIKYLGLMSALIIITFVFFALETLLGTGGINTYSFLAWGTLLFTLISAYLGFFRSQKS
jgi:hypothetical protein